MGILILLKKGGSDYGFYYYYYGWGRIAKIGIKDFGLGLTLD